MKSSLGAQLRLMNALEFLRVKQRHLLLGKISCVLLVFCTFLEKKSKKRRCKIMLCLGVLMLNTCDDNYNKVLITLDSADWQTSTFWLGLECKCCQNPFDFHRRRCLAKCSCWSFPYNENWQNFHLWVNYSIKSLKNSLEFIKKSNLKNVNYSKMWIDI